MNRCSHYTCVRMVYVTCDVTCVCVCVCLRVHINSCQLRVKDLESVWKMTQVEPRIAKFFPLGEKTRLSCKGLAQTVPVNGGVHSSVRVSSCCVATYSWVKKWLQIGGVCNYWTGIWDGGCTVTGAVVQGCASYCVSRAVISPQRLYERVQCCQHSSLYSILV